MTKKRTQPFSSGAPAFLTRGFGKSKARAPSLAAVDKNFRKRPKLQKSDFRKRGARPRFM